MELTRDLVLVNQKFDTKEEAIRAVGQLLVENGAVDASYIDSMLEREQIVTTYMGNFVAIPHGTDEGKKYVKHTAISVVQVPAGVDFANDDDEKLAMLLFGIAGVGNEHLDLLSKIAVLCSDVSNVTRLADASSAEEIIQIIEEEEV